MRLLITGASGLLGANLSLAALDAGVEVTTSSLERRLSDERLNWRPADLTVAAQAMRLVESAAPEWIINCAAATDVNRCERESEWAMSLNRDAPRDLAHAAAKVGARMIHVSTDAVFDGRRGGYSEQDDPRPVNVYGASKLAGEQAVMELIGDALIIRTNIFGWGPPGRPSLAEWFLDRLQAGQQCPGFADVIFCPLLVNQLALLLLRLTGTLLAGVYHLAAGDCLSKYEFGRRLAQEFSCDPNLVRPTSVDRAELGAARPKNLTLDVGKVERDLGMQMPRVEAEIQALKRLAKSGQRERVRALTTVQMGQSSTE